MQTIEKGSIKNLYVSTYTRSGNNTTLVLSDAVIKEDAEFYRNITGKLISFDYDTHLASRDEATDLIVQAIENNPNTTLLSCLFVDYDEVEYAGQISEKAFKQLSKRYKDQRKQSNQK